MNSKVHCFTQVFFHISFIHTVTHQSTMNDIEFKDIEFNTCKYTAELVYFRDLVALNSEEYTQMEDYFNEKDLDHCVICECDEKAREKERKKICQHQLHHALSDNSQSNAHVLPLSFTEDVSLASEKSCDAEDA